MKLAAAPDALKARYTGEALTALRQKPVNMTTLERIRLFDEADALVAGLPQPLQYGRGLQHVLLNISLPIDAHDLLLGRVAERVPTPAEEACYQAVCARFARPWGEDSRPLWVLDGGHMSFYWRDVVTHGLSGLRQRAQARLDSETDAARRTFLTGAVCVYDALQTYLLRYADAARALGMQEAAEVCHHAATRAPRHFREALQMLWGIMLVYCSLLAANPTLTYGRMDVLLHDLYERDLRDGVLTREEAGLLVLDFYSKNNLNMGRGEHQLGVGEGDIQTGWNRNLNYDAPQYMPLGGKHADGRWACTDLTQLMVDTIVPGYKNPVVVFRYAEGLLQAHGDLWQTLVGKMRASASVMVYNEDNVREGYMRAGVLQKDAADAEHYGCNWPCLPGIEVKPAGDIRLWAKDVSEDEADRMRYAFRIGTAPGDLSGELLLLVQRYAREGTLPAGIDGIYADLLARFDEIIRLRIENAAMARRLQYRNAPGPLQMMDCFCRDTIDRACSLLCGGATYFGVNQVYRGFATFVDSMTALDALLYGPKALPVSQLCEALAAGFDGYPQVLARCRRAPKLGSDDPLANAHASRLLTVLTDAVYRAQATFSRENPQEEPIILRQCIETDMRHIEIGARLPATPDGRLAGTPVSQNTQPSPGAASQGLTAMLRSLASLPPGRILSGALNITIQPSLFAGMQGLEQLAAILGTYFALGGLQAQVSAVDLDTLRDAQRNPDAHRDLMVRVTGYSAVFVDMNRQAQDDFIRRQM